MKYNFYIPYNEYFTAISEQLRSYGDCYALVSADEKSVIDNSISVDSYLSSSKVLNRIFNVASDADKYVFITKSGNYKFNTCFFDKFICAESLVAYSDYELVGKGIQPLIDYQSGSIRDNFDFGSILVFDKKVKSIIEKSTQSCKYLGIYDLMLRISEVESPLHISEVSYTEETIIDKRNSGERQFDYLDPKNRDLQIEAETIATEHLKRIGAFIDYKKLNKVNFNEQSFTNLISVIIPVYNREKTIADAVKSALSQKLNKPFNVIVVDNHSTDKTTSILNSLASENKSLIHIIPEETDLKIGGCWNKAIQSKYCGMFAVQLDSDDIYKDENTLSKIVDKFYSEQCAMVIGSYSITNFNLQPLPPGLIDHKEWTSENGMNNALRINGLGAPRAFYTPVARQILFENCSYGEDYAMGLAISRQFALGRIFESLYICRRWDGNSDANLSREKENVNNFNKDKMRTNEIEKRILLNKIS